jgi:purine-nucleoside phosphorylase
MVSFRAMTNEHLPLRSQLLATKDAILARAPGAKPRVGVVLGSGLGAFADSLSRLVKIPFGELPHMFASSVAGHAGNLCLGEHAGVSVICMQGRVHSYEGHPVATVVHGVRTMAALGVDSVLLTNAAGGVEASWSAGDLMLVSDHINLTGTNPLTGPNDSTLGPRFPDMTRAYDPELSEGLRTAAKKHGIELREGVYVGLPGPTYETPAEVRMVRLLGGHAVGMSTVLETIALRHMGVRVAAVSCITNMAAGITGALLDHAEVEETAKARRADFMKLVGAFLEGQAGHGRAGAQ